jgi:hypothetical protein
MRSAFPSDLHRPGGALTGCLVSSQAHLVLCSSRFGFDENGSAIGFTNFTRYEAWALTEHKLKIELQKGQRRWSSLNLVKAGEGSCHGLRRKNSAFLYDRGNFRHSVRSGSTPDAISDLHHLRYPGWRELK